MEKKYTYIFLGLSAAFFLFVVGLTAYRIENTRKQNAAAADQRTAELAELAVSLRETTGGFESSLFKAEMKYSFEREPRLLLLSIHSDEQGMLYLITRNRVYLDQPVQITPQWRGEPIYRFARGYEALSSRPVSTEAGDATLDALYLVMARDDFFGILRDDLYLFLAFLFICGLFILIVTSIQTEDDGTAEKDKPRPSQRPAEAPRRKPFAQAADSRAPPTDQATAAQAAAQPAGAQATAAQAVAQAAPRGGLFSPVTGLVWLEYFPARLRAEIERASTADLDLALARVLIDDPPPEPQRSALYKSCARLLRQASATTEDLLFEAGPGAFSLILPDTDIDAAVRRMDGIRRKLGELSAGGLGRAVSVGVASRGGRLIDDRVLLEEAELSAAKASAEGGNQVIGFRADPAKFREALSSLRS